MYFLWKIQIERCQNPDEWVNQIEDFLGISIPGKDSHPVEENAANNPAGNWFRTVKAALDDLRAYATGPIRTLNVSDGARLELVDIAARFSRYEQLSFLILLFKYDADDAGGAKCLPVMETQEKVARLLEQEFSGATHSFTVTIKMEEDKYKEQITILNPIPIICASDGNILDDRGWRIVAGDSYTRYYRVEYKKTQDMSYLRVFSVVYVLHRDIAAYVEPPGQRSSFYDIVHTEILYFIRGAAFERELSWELEKTAYLRDFTKVICKHWPKIRAQFLVLPRFDLRNLGRRLLFGLLESNAQALALLNRLKYRAQDCNLRFTERFERLDFTVKRICTKDEHDYFELVQSLVLAFYQAHMKSLGIVEGTLGEIDRQVEKLRSDCDSNNNYTLQWLMFVLSLTIVFWGGVALFYEKWFRSIDAFVDNPPLAIATLLGLVIAAFFAVTIPYTNKLSRLLSKRTIAMVERWLNSCRRSLVKIEDVLNSGVEEAGKLDSFAQRTAKVLELVSVLTAAVTMDRVSNIEGREHLKAIESVLSEESRTCVPRARGT